MTSEFSFALTIIILLFVLNSQWTWLVWQYHMEFNNSVLFLIKLNGVCPRQIKIRTTKTNDPITVPKRRISVMIQHQIQANYGRIMESEAFQEFKTSLLHQCNQAYATQLVLDYYESSSTFNILCGCKACLVSKQVGKSITHV